MNARQAMPVARVNQLSTYLSLDHERLQLYSTCNYCNSQT